MKQHNDLNGPRRYEGKDTRRMARLDHPGRRPGRIIMALLLAMVTGVAVASLVAFY